MSSLWSSAVMQQNASPFLSNGSSQSSGENAATKLQTLLQAAGTRGQSVTQPALKSGSNSSMVQTSAAASSSGSSSSGSDSAISANDFLTLLVTEMQNQDPTADTDPNEYINQLVQINSLEQLISINQNLSTVLGTASSITPSNGVGASSVDQAAVHSPSQASSVETVRSAASVGKSFASPASSADGAVMSAKIHGNLSLPADDHAAHSVARALDGRHQERGHAIRDISTRALP